MPIAPMIPSGSTSGRCILVVAVATPGTLLHTAVAGADDMDEVYIYVSNADTVERDVTLELGGVTSPGDTITKTIQPLDGELLMVPGRRFNGGVVLRAFGSAASVLTASLTVNRYTAP